MAQKPDESGSSGKKNLGADSLNLSTPLIHNDEPAAHEIGDTVHGGHVETAVTATDDTIDNVANGSATNGSATNGSAANSNGHNGHFNGAAGENALSVDDPRTRALLEQLLTVVNQDGSGGGTESSARGGAPAFASVLRRRWKTALLMFLLVTTAISWKLRPGEVSYVATATMLLPKSSSSSSDAASVLTSLGGRRDAAGNTLDTQIAILESYPFVEKVQLRAKENLISFLPAAQSKAAIAAIDAATIKATAPLSPELVDITVTSDDPNASRAMANASVQVYDKELVRQSDATLSSDRAFVSRSVQEVGAELAKAKRDLQNFKEANNVFNIDTSLTTSSATIEQLKDKERSLRINAEAGPTGSLVLGDAITQSLQQRASDARLKYDNVLRDFYPSSPEAQAARADLAAAQSQVDQRIAKLTSQATQQANDAARELAEAERRAANLPAVEFQLSQLNAKVQQLADTYKTVTDRLTTLKLHRQCQSRYRVQSGAGARSQSGFAHLAARNYGRRAHRLSYSRFVRDDSRAVGSFAARCRRFRAAATRAGSGRDAAVARSRRTSLGSNDWRATDGSACFGSVPHYPL